MVAIVCVACHAVAERSQGLRTGKMCLDCMRGHGREQWAAITAMRKAIRNGLMPKASARICVDCGKPATEYDHRDYTKPIDVQPVCRSCNHKRGYAFNSFYRPAEETKSLHFAAISPQASQSAITPICSPSQT